MEKVALITGASYGLGYALAVEAARAGFHVLAVGRTQGALDELADEIDRFNGAVTIAPMDITEEGAIPFLANSIAGRWGRLDLWLHTAWFTAPMQPVNQLLVKDLEKAWKTNIKATTALIAHLDPLMRQGHAVFFDQENLDQAYLSNIAISKGAQMQIVRSWAKEVAKMGPKVTVLKPAMFFSNLSATLYPGKMRKDLPSAKERASEIWSNLDLHGS